MSDRDKCQHCSRPIGEGQPVVSLHDDLFHEACWRKWSSRRTLEAARERLRRSRSLLDGSAELWKPENERDARGWPICPGCQQALYPGDGARREGAFMVHVDCL
jgi:hypothetical protein